MKNHATSFASAGKNLSSLSNAEKPYHTETSPSSSAKNANPETTFQAIREIVETLAVALFLALLFKTFEAEAFVIPTGSMAPTLKGRHKDVICQECRFPFQISASQERDSLTNQPTASHVVAGTCPQCGFTQYFGTEAPSFTGDRIFVNKFAFDFRDLCRWDVSVFRSPPDPKINFIKRIVGLPNERLRIQYGDIFISRPLDSGNTNPGTSNPSNAKSDSNAAVPSGDSDASNTFAVTEDVAVLNRSTVSDASKTTWSEFEIVRKPLPYLREMLQTVYDADYPISQIETLHWPNRWIDELNETTPNTSAWQYDPQKHVYYYPGALRQSDSNVVVGSPKIQALSSQTVSSSNESKSNLYWLRYQNIVPSSTDWNNLSQNTLPVNVEKSGKIAHNPLLITDMTAYNTGLSRNTSTSMYDDSRYFEEIHRGSDRYWQCRKSPIALGGNWVGDLAVSFDLTFPEIGDALPSEPNEFVIELVKGGQNFRCHFYPIENQIVLEIPDIPEYEPETASFVFSPGKTYNILFMNIDEQLRLVIDDQEIAFPYGGEYDHLCRPLTQGEANILPRNRDPNEKDLTPVSLGISGQQAEVHHLKILRDLYYIATGPHQEKKVPFLTFSGKENLYLFPGNSDRLVLGNHDFSREDSLMQFFSDSNQWQYYGNTNAVFFELGQGEYLALGDNSSASQDSREWGTINEKLLIGKAFYVYWPHGKPIPGTKLPLIPNFGKMRHIN